MYPNVQAYDRGVMFNPDGRLFQVEYAKEAVRKGATSIGLVVKEGVLFVAHKNINDPLAVAGTIQKVFRIDSHIGATYSGMVSDGLHLVNMARSNAQNHRLLFNEVKSVEALAKEMSAYMMQATMYGGMRPYAVSVLLGGIDSTPRLFEIEPGASFLGYKADAIGVGKKIATDILVKEYKDNMKLEDGIGLGIKILKKVNEVKLTTENVDIGYIYDAEEYTMLSQNEISKYL
ncbi:MAG: archaeal proteasome endopeptidase complex subunit alpha [Candidatus Micrarchaeota archaeon]|nr:archaeal proteasome endopeptidase complex subunit alpha [Candidatus Micrarchaeota archaeon]MDE1847455.1 archaeal proteasome endopeptidase complex subunit alpha [Candidatus Micrarchaeota archaeon]MDE1864050.1 archaeal proteasome endopeptidase complex subunit alpha [Candidatus Micrarchaeota archaeon]